MIKFEYMIRQISFSSFLFLFVMVVSGGNKPEGRDNEVLSIININESHWQSFIYDEQLYEERIDTLAKIRFWTMIMQTSSDYMIMNDASTRKVLHVIKAEDYRVLSDYDKDKYRDLLRKEHGLFTDARIFATTGKSEFYQFRKAMPGIDRGIQVFMEHEVDPWYAQAILLIESPGQLMRSPDGALGSFQLMDKVARKFGLRVDREIDERKDFERSAYGAAMLIKSICLPHTRNMLQEINLEFNETDLWFRLLVLHVYHAGAYNVKGALGSIEDPVGGMTLIRELWETESGGFRNASQNYTQVALASLLQLNNLIYQDCIIYHSTNIPVKYTGELPVGMKGEDTKEVASGP